ncbi:MAG TPA: 2-C-methyl-D-erythritol 4-phosphate cytidylyltransferase [Candidatus Kapabacteria bacterium]|nr:2-C-methyl-D-erythritol 4-phosphate cytidylyltransferase [Candidatus Kapabacteria bacterium]
MNFVAIIVAGGVGKRFNSELPKQFIELNGIPIIIRTISIFEQNENINSIIIAMNEDWISYFQEMLKLHNFKKIHSIVKGGEQRHNSVFNALNTEIARNSDFILIHDAVRCFTTQNLLNDLIKNAIEFGAVIPGIKPKDTVKKIIQNNVIETTVDRNSLLLVQTPQVFKKDIIFDSYQKINNDIQATDDSYIVELAGYQVKVIEGEERNIKITTPLDLEIGKLFV